MSTTKLNPFDPKWCHCFQLSEKYMLQLWVEDEDEELQFAPYLSVLEEGEDVGVTFAGPAADLGIFFLSNAGMIIHQYLDKEQLAILASHGVLISATEDTHFSGFEAFISSLPEGDLKQFLTSKI